MIESSVRALRCNRPASVIMEFPLSPLRSSTARAVRCDRHSIRDCVIVVEMKLGESVETRKRARFCDVTTGTTKCEHGERREARYARVRDLLGVAKFELGQGREAREARVRYHVVVIKIETR